MPEQPPELLEQLDSGPAGVSWRARLADGQEVVATQVLLGEETARKNGVDRLRRLAKIQSPNLAPIRGWWSDGQGVWFVSDQEQGLGLADLPAGGFLSPQQAAAVSFGALAGLEAIHNDGLNHGALSANNLRVMPDGKVQLTGHQLATVGFPSPADLAAEVREAGRLVCQAFGITPERDPRAAPRAIEHAAPALVVTARAIASGNFGPDLRTAVTALRDTSGPLAGAERQSIGTQELAAAVVAKRSGGQPAQFRSLAAPIAAAAALGASTTTPAAAPLAGAAPLAAAADARRAYGPTPAAGVPVAASTSPRRSWEERQARPLPHEYSGPSGGSRRWLVVAGIIALVLIAIPAGIWAAGKLGGGGGQTETTATPPSATATAGIKPKTSAPPPATAGSGAAPVPTFAPPAAGSVREVTATPTTACQPGGSCTINVVIKFKPAGSPHDVTWKFKTFDPCTRQSVELGGGLITAQGDWNTTDGNSAVSLPAAKGQLIVVAISGPEEAASPPIVLGTSAC